jgi:protein O-mannosyl-transferase
MSLSSSASAPEQEVSRPAHVRLDSEAEPRSAGKTNSSAPTHFHLGQSNLLWCFGLIAAVLLVYNPVTHNGFVNWDDDNYIVNNPHVKAGLTWATVKWAFTTYDHANWAPLSWLSHALDCQLFGLNPLGHHYVSVLIHAANAVLLFLLLQSATGFRWRSLMVAALFAVHPVNVESVAWAAERKNVLSMLFFLLAFQAYVRYTRRPALSRYAAVFLLFALGLLSKSQVITFPCLLWLWDYWPLHRIFTPTTAETFRRKGVSPRAWRLWLVLEKLPLFGLCAASAVITTQAEKAGGAVRSLSQYSLSLRLETAVISYVRYLGKAFWPTKLVALYPHATRLYPAWQVGLAVLLLLLITAWVLIAQQRRYRAVGWFWFLGSLVPMIGLVQVGYQAMADRFVYIPLIGILVMVTWLIADWATQHRISSKTLAIPAVFLLAVLGTLTYKQVGYWHDVETFWRRTLAGTQDNYVAEVNLGEFLYGEDRIDEAATHFRSALEIIPEGLSANLNLGAYEDKRGNTAAAIERYQTVALKATDPALRATAYGSLGFAYRRLGETEKATQSFETALQVAPDRARALIGLGLLAQDRGDLAEAIRLYSLAASRQQSDVIRLLLAQGYQRLGRTEEAKTNYQGVSGSQDLPRAEKEVEQLLSGK